MQIVDCVWLELYTNNFGGYKVEENYIWGYANKRDWLPLHWRIWEPPRLTSVLASTACYKDIFTFDTHEALYDFTSPFLWE
jgi:hypothetical protein